MNIFRVIADNISPKILLIVACLVAGWLAFYYTSNYLVTRTAFAVECKRLVVMIAAGDTKQRLETLYLRKSLTERQIWDLEDRVTNPATRDRPKWERRLKKTEKELQCIERQIEELR